MSPAWTWISPRLIIPVTSAAPRSLRGYIIHIDRELSACVYMPQVLKPPYIQLPEKRAKRNSPGDSNPGRSCCWMLTVRQRLWLVFNIAGYCQIGHLTDKTKMSVFSFSFSLSFCILLYPQTTEWSYNTALGTVKTLDENYLAQLGRETASQARVQF